MGEKILTKEKLDEFIKGLRSEYTVYGPIVSEGEARWSKIEEAGQLAFDFSNTSLSPKSFFFPQTECMLEFKNDPRDSHAFLMKEVPPLDEKRVILNMRPCDARAFKILDRVFYRDDDARDVYWIDKREKTIIMTLACNNPCSTCFCTSVGSGPFDEEGADVLCVDLGDRVLLKGITDRGSSVIESLEEATEEDISNAQGLKQKSESAIGTSLQMDNILSREVLEVYELPMWDRIHETCLNCGACTFYCPTCHCFDIQDETQGDYGRRVRNWDTCMSWLFTQHASGHNPRGTKKDRVRQRFMHKFKYMPIKLDGIIGCVGCGRCIKVCPVNIDVREVVKQMNE